MKQIEQAIEALEMATKYPKSKKWTNVISLDARYALDEALTALRQIKEVDVEGLKMSHKCSWNDCLARS